MGTPRSSCPYAVLTRIQKESTVERTEPCARTGMGRCDCRKGTDPAHGSRSICAFEPALQVILLTPSTVEDRTRNRDTPVKVLASMGQRQSARGICTVISRSTCGSRPCLHTQARASRCVIYPTHVPLDLPARTHGRKGACPTRHRGSVTLQPRAYSHNRRTHSERACARARRDVFFVFY